MKIQMESKISNPRVACSLPPVRGHRGQIDHGAARAERLHLLLPCRPFPNPLELAFSFAMRAPSPSARCRRARRAVSPRRRPPQSPPPLLQRSHHLRYPSAQAEPGNHSVASRWSSQARSPPPQATGEMPPRHSMAVVALLPWNSPLESSTAPNDPPASSSLRR